LTTRRQPALFEPLRFVGIDELGGRPHVMVDGAQRPGSVRVLSHWPGTPTPKKLWRDLSVEIAFAYLASRRDWSLDADCVSLDHLDEDGLASLFVLSEPESALRLKDRLISFGRAGDFGVVDDRDSARAVFAIESLCDQAISPWRERASGSAPWSTICIEELLSRLEEILTRPALFESAWHVEDAKYAASLEAIANGEVTIDERPGASLAVVRVRSRRGKGLSADRDEIPTRAHPFVIHTATSMPRILVLDGDRAHYYDRYETWVRFVSRRLELRRDLRPLAEHLSSMEKGSVIWEADSPGKLVPRLAPSGSSTLAPETIEQAVTEHLERASVAWDPFRSQRPVA